MFPDAVVMRVDGSFGLVCLYLVAFGGNAIADELKITGALEQGMEYDDNIALTEESTPSFGYLLQPSFAVNWNTPVLGVGISGRGDIRRYDDERWNCDNFSLGLNQKYQDRRNILSVALSYAQSCAYSQQVSDTGILLPNSESDSYNVAPEWNWSWTQLDQLSFSPGYSRSSFTTGSSTNLGSTDLNYQNNDTYSFDLTEKHQWNRLLSTSLGGYFSNSEFSDSTSSTSQYVFGFQIGGQYVINRAWLINAGGGGRWVQSPSSQRSTVSDDADSLIFTEVANILISYSGQQYGGSLGYSRTVSPSAFGQLLEYSSVDLRCNYQILRDLTLNIDGSYSENQPIGQSDSQLAQSRNYFSASTGLVWRFDKSWQLSATYRYRGQEFPNADAVLTNSSQAGLRNSNAIMLHLNYNWDGFRISP